MSECVRIRPLDCALEHLPGASWTAAISTTIVLSAIMRSHTQLIHAYIQIEWTQFGAGVYCPCPGININNFPHSFSCSESWVDNLLSQFRWVQKSTQIFSKAAKYDTPFSIMLLHTPHLSSIGKWLIVVGIVVNLLIIISEYKVYSRSRHDCCAGRAQQRCREK